MSTRSLPSYLTLKTRFVGEHPREGVRSGDGVTHVPRRRRSKPGQGGADDVESRDLKAELEERERQHFLRKEKEKVAAGARWRLRRRRPAVHEALTRAPQTPWP